MSIIFVGLFVAIGLVCFICWDSLPKAECSGVLCPRCGKDYLVKYTNYGSNGISSKVKCKKCKLKTGYWRGPYLESGGLDGALEEADRIAKSTTI